MDAYHWPPDLLELLVATIPLLCRSKDAVLNFFEGAGVDARDLRAMKTELRKDRDAVSKYQIARDILTRVNRRGDEAIRARREVLRRVVQFEDFSVCWPNDQLSAEGLVARVRSLVNVKDAFTRMKDERDREREQRQKDYEREAELRRRRREELVEIRDELGAVFAIANPWKRGKALEKVLNNLFRVLGVLIREDFQVRGDEGEGVVEQIDGVVELDSHLYIVELKWEKGPLDVTHVSRHLVRVMGREARGLMIAANGFGPAAVAECRNFLSHRVMVLLDLQLIVRTLAEESDLLAFLRKTIHEVILTKNPYPHAR